MGVNEVIQVCQPEHKLRHCLDRTVPYPAIKPVGEAGEQRIQPQERGPVERIKIKRMAEYGKRCRRQPAQVISSFGTFNRLSTVEVPAQAKTQEHDEGRQQHDRYDAALAE